MGNNHLQWFDSSKRKVLVLSFENHYLKQISKCLSKIDIDINDAIGFRSDDIIYKKEIYPYIGTLLNITFKEDNNATLNISEYAAIHFGSIFITIGISIASAFLAGFIINICNCYLALRYFNDSEFFNVNDTEPFPWDDERVELQVRYNSRLGT